MPPLRLQRPPAHRLHRLRQRGQPCNRARRRTTASTRSSTITPRRASWSRPATPSSRRRPPNLAPVADGEVDVIIGTQMVDPGAHFPALTLVGVIAPIWAWPAAICGPASAPFPPSAPPGRRPGRPRRQPGSSVSANPPARKPGHASARRRRRGQRFLKANGRPDPRRRHATFGPRTASSSAPVTRPPPTMYCPVVSSGPRFCLDRDRRVLV